VRIFAHSITTNGRPGILMVLHDISKQRLAEKVVRQSEQFLHTVLDSIPPGYFGKTEIPFSWVPISGWQTIWALPRLLIWWVNPIMISTQRKWLRNTSTTIGEVMNNNEEKLFYEEVQPQSNGTLRWKLTSKVPLKDIGGNVIGLLGTYDDITARRQAEADLKLARFSIDQCHQLGFVDIEGWANS
jgi:PAS domain-containing protein